MIETDRPVSLPGSSIPEGVSEWTAQDAGGWAAPHPPRWARPLWPALVALAAALVAAFLPATGPACGTGDPCGPDWLGLCTWGLVLGQVLWSLCFCFPELVLLGAPALMTLVVVETFPLPGGVYAAVTGVVLTASAATWAAAGWRLLARRRQRLAAGRVAGASRHRVPGGEAAALRGTIRIVVALVLLGVVAGAVGMALRGIHDDARRAERAAHLTGTVVKTGDVSIRVRAGGVTRTLDAESPHDYRLGQRVEVLADGTWARLAQEPYAPVGWQLLALAVALPALPLLTSGIRARRRDTALLRRPAPVLRAVAVFDGRGNAWVRPADEASGRFVLRCWAEPLGNGPGTRTRTDAPQWEAAGDKDEAEVDRRPREVLVYGAPRASSPVVLVTAVPDDGPAVLRTGPLVLPRAGELPRWDRPRVSRTVPVPAPERLREIGARLPTGGRVRRWGPSVADRAGAGAVVLTAAAIVWAQGARLRSGADVISGAPLLWMVFAPWFAAVLGAWRITADRGGVWLTGVWKVRHIPWEQVTRVAWTEEGHAEISGSAGVRWQRASLRRRRGRSSSARPAHLRAAEGIAAMQAHPQLRPGEDSRTRDRGMPLGPLLVAFFVLWTAAAFLV
ncbi:hypothetical protein [Streptomyces sp. NBC_00996]|uniref:hypothetical protein n=1 Tax=Streptomyces sp. NBC_00996 TaxID=2903710 RepID=UPI003869DBCA|nr:hypothetical protein OG390_28740 [Streptomyces sp. NBC_00996]